MEVQLLGIPRRRVKYILSPCAVYVTDGAGKVVGKLLYVLDTDVGKPLTYDPANVELLADWTIQKSPMPKVKCGTSGSDLFSMSDPPCEDVDCPWHGLVWFIKRIMFDLVQDRTYPSVGLWDIDAFSGTYVPSKFFKATFHLVEMPVDEMEDPGAHWKSTWTSSNMSLWRMRKMQELTVGFCQDILSNDGENNFRWEELPFEVYEELVKYLDGRTLMNLCGSSPLLAAKALEAYAILSSHRREPIFHKFCTRDFDGATVTKILSSFDTVVFPKRTFDGNKTQRNKSPACSWEEIFTAYFSYWKTLVEGKVRTQRLRIFENKLRCDMLVKNQEMETVLRITRSGGGRLLFNVLFPWSSDLGGSNLVVVEDFNHAISKHQALLCPSQTLTNYAVKIMYFPIVRTPTNSEAPEVDQVLVSICSNCIITTPFQGGTTRKIDMTFMHEENLSNWDPVFEAYEYVPVPKPNVMALWLYPSCLLFYLLVPSPDVGGYDICTLYRLQPPNMEKIWRRFNNLRPYYLPVIREYSGMSDAIGQHARSTLCSENGRLKKSAQNVYYGLVLVSPIYGLESFKPPLTSDGPETVMESLEPQYYLRNGRKYLPLMRKPSCSGKGHDLFIFCSNSAIGVSWDCVTWLFGDLSIPATVHQDKDMQQVTYVEVIHHDGLLLVVNDDILLMELSCTTRPTLPEKLDGELIPEPELHLKPLRVFQLGLAPFYMKITQLELNFDCGRPFFLLVAEQEQTEVMNSTSVESFDNMEWKEYIREKFRFVIKRIDFDN